MKFLEFYNKVDNSVGVAKILFNYLSKKYPSKKIKDIAKTISGGTPNRAMSVYYGGNIPWIKSGELNDGLITSYEETITEDGLKNSSAKRYPKGTLVIALYGATVGKTGILDFDSTSNQAVCAVFPNDEISKEYLFWFFRQKRLEFLQQSFGGAQPNINQDVVKNTEVPVPPKNIQESVQKLLFHIEKTKQVFDVKEYSTIIPQLQEFVTTKEKYDLARRIFSENFELIQKLRQAILQEAVSGKLVPQDPNDEPASEQLDKIKVEKEKLIKEKKIKKNKPLPPIIREEIPYELPKQWEWVKLGDLVSILGDGIHGTPNYTDEGEYFFINGNNLSDGKIIIKPSTKRVSLEEYNKYKKTLNKRTVFVSINGTIGNVAFYNNEKIILGKSACYFNLLGDISKEYIKIIINTFYFLDYALKNATGTTIKNVSLESMRFFLVPIPPLSEQKRIVEKVDQLMNLCDELETKVKENQKNSELLMDTVLRDAFEK